MAFATLAPSVYVSARTFNDYAQALAKTRLYLIGGATKGPVNKPVLCRSLAELLDNFGPPVVSDFGLLSAAEFLRKAAAGFAQTGGEVYYQRVANGGVSASTSIEGPPGVKAAGLVNISVLPVDSNVVTISDGTVSKTFEFDTNAAVTSGNILVPIPQTGTTNEKLAAMSAALTSAINAAAYGVVAVQSGLNFNQVAITNKNPGTLGNVAIVKTGSFTASGMSGGTNDGSTAAVTFTAISPGTWGNALKVLLNNTTVVGAPSGNYDVTVYAPLSTDGVLQVVERFLNVSNSQVSPRFIETVFANGINGEIPPSRYLLADADPTHTQPASGTFAIGADGISALADADYIGSFSPTGPTGLQVVRHAENVDFNLLCIPGNSHVNVITEMLAVAISRSDCFALIDEPDGLTSAQVADWHNGLLSLVPNSPTQPLDTPWGGLYYAWQDSYSDFTKTTVRLPPSPFVAATMANTDLAIGPWQGAAGDRYGRVKSDKSAASPSLYERQTYLQVGANAVNPIVDRGAPIGPVIMGNRTLQRTPGPTDAVHVMRLLILLMKLTAAAARDFQFRPNTPGLWAEFKARVKPIYQRIRDAGGMEPFPGVPEGFDIKCDEVTNNAQVRARKEMNAKILLKHVDLAEVITLDFTLLTNTGAVAVNIT